MFHAYLYVMHYIKDFRLDALEWLTVIQSKHGCEFCKIVQEDECETIVSLVVFDFGGCPWVIDGDIIPINVPQSVFERPIRQMLTDPAAFILAGSRSGCALSIFVPVGVTSRPTFIKRIRTRSTASHSKRFV